MIKDLIFLLIKGAKSNPPATAAIILPTWGYMIAALGSEDLLWVFRGGVVAAWTLFFGPIIALLGYVLVYIIIDELPEQPESK